MNQPCQAKFENKITGLHLASDVQAELGTKAGAYVAARCGFTLVEMMVTVAVIALLMGILLPAIRSVRTQANQSSEMNTARQLMVAFSNYANVNNDKVIPGYYNDPKLRIRDDRNNAIELISVRERYPWRLLPYLDYKLEGLYNNAVLDDLEQMRYEELGCYQYFVSFAPSLGMNTEFVGGDKNAGAFNAGLSSVLGRFYITTLSQPRHTDRLMVFASSRSVFESPPSFCPITGAGEGSQLPVEGFHKLQSPYWTQSTGYRWKDNMGNDVEHFDESLEPAAYGFISPRYNGHAVTAFIDAHVEALRADLFQDMRYWCDLAEVPDWTLGGN